LWDASDYQIELFRRTIIDHPAIFFISLRDELMGGAIDRGVPEHEIESYVDEWLAEFYKLYGRNIPDYIINEPIEDTLRDNEGIEDYNLTPFIPTVVRPGMALGHIGGSYGYRAIDTRTGRAGYVISGHVARQMAEEGNNSALGPVTHRQISGPIDAAFISLHSFISSGIFSITIVSRQGNFQFYTFELSTVTWRYLYIGLNVASNGAMSGVVRNGPIADLSVQATSLRGDVMWDLVAVRTLGRADDSGGIFFIPPYGSADGNGTIVDTAGILVGAQGLNILFSRATLINERFGISRY